MPIHQTGRQYTRDGRPFCSFDSWLKSLPIQQQQEYEQARQRQHAYRQDAIDRGDLILLLDQSYVWKDQKTMEKGKPQDEVWASYHARWSEENAIISESITKEI
jgi:hypothetical protein